MGIALVADNEAETVVVAKFPRFECTKASALLCPHEEKSENNKNHRTSGSERPAFGEVMVDGLQLQCTERPLIITKFQSSNPLAT